MRTLALASLVVLAGCIGGVRDSTTARTAQEQLLCTTAAQRAIGALDSRVFAGRRVFVDVERIQTQVDRGYVLAAVEQRISEAKGRLARTRDQADLVVEMRAAALGTFDGSWNIYVPVLMAPGVTPPADAPPLLQIGYALQEGWCRLDGYCYDAQTSAYVCGWRQSWGMAYVGFFDDIYPEKTVAQTVEARVR